MRHPNSSMPLKTRIFGVEEVENSVVLILNWSISMNHEVFYLVLFTEEAKHTTNSVTITSSTQIVVFNLSSTSQQNIEKQQIPGLGQETNLEYILIPQGKDAIKDS